MSPSGATAAGLRLSVMMFLQFFVWGAWYVTMNPYMKAHGMEGVIFWAYTVGPIAAIASPFFLGMVADRFFASERVLAVMHLAGGVALMLAPSAAAYEWGWAPQTGALSFLREGPFIGMLLLHMLCYMPTLGLTNTVAFHAMDNPAKQFPLVRVWGTIGWIVAGLAVSWLEADRSQGQFILAGAAAIVLGLYSFTLPHTPPPAAGRPFAVRDALGLDALSMLRRRPFLIFIVCSFLLCIPLAAYYSYASGFVDALGVKAVAATMSRGQMSEIFFMFVMPLCFGVLGVKWMLAVGMLAWVVRYGLFAWAAEPSGAGVDWPAWATWILGDPALPMAVFIGILLHGVCYDFFFVTGFIYTEREAPKAIRASAQGFLVLVTQGLGMLVGAQIAGWLHGATVTGGAETWRAFWAVPALFALAVLIFFVLTFRDRGTKAPDVDALEAVRA